MNLRSQAIAPLLLVAALGSSTLVEARALAALPPAPQDSAQELDAARNAWLAETHLSLGANSDGSWIGFGTAMIDSAPGPTWGPARIAAFERAESEARASFVELMGITVSAESIAGLFEDDSAFEDLLDPARQAERDVLKHIEAKLEALPAEQLVQALELLGLGPQELEQLSEPEQRVALSESFKSSVATRSMRQLRGLRVIQTFEQRGAETYSVGVLVRWSEDNAKLAEVVRHGKGSIAQPAEGKPLEQWLPQDDQALLREWGVRVFAGPKGEPLVVCFSQAAIGVVPEDPARVQAAKRRAAQMRAKTFAQRDLTQFINATTVVDQVATRAEAYEVSLKLFPDGFADHDTGSGALEQTLRHSIETSGEAVISGGQVVRTWQATLPGSDAEFCGVVYVWSPTRARLAYDFAAGKAPEGQPADEETDEAGNDYPVDF